MFPPVMPGRVDAPARRGLPSGYQNRARSISFKLTDGLRRIPTVRFALARGGFNAHSHRGPSLGIRSQLEGAADQLSSLLHADEAQLAASDQVGHVLGD